MQMDHQSKIDNDKKNQVQVYWENGVRNDAQLKGYQKAFVNMQMELGSMWDSHLK